MASNRPSAVPAASSMRASSAPPQAPVVSRVKPRQILFGAAVAAAALCHARGSHAQSSDGAADADLLFRQAMELRSAGNTVAACPKFLASKQLAPAVGVTLYLADCYERTGRKASAWGEFREGEKLARARNDKRADVAAQRAAALEPALGRLTISGSRGTAQAGTDVKVDGASLSPEFWGSTLAVDHGDHIVTVASPGHAAKTYFAHVDASHPSAVVVVGEPVASSAQPPAPGPESAVEPASAEATGDQQLHGRIAGVGLMIAGAVGVGLGTWLVTDKIAEMSNGQLGQPHLRPNAAPEGALAFSLGGVALLSGAVLFYVNRPGRAEVGVSPAPVPGGGGAVLRGTF